MGAWAHGRVGAPARWRVGDRLEIPISGRESRAVEAGVPGVP